MEKKIPEHHAKYSNVSMGTFMPKCSWPCFCDGSNHDSMVVIKISALLARQALTAPHPMLLCRTEQNLPQRSVLDLGFIGPRRQVPTFVVHSLSLSLRCHQHLGQWEKTSNYFPFLHKNSLFTLIFQFLTLAPYRTFLLPCPLTVIFYKI